MNPLSLLAQVATPDSAVGDGTAQTIVTHRAA